MWNTLCSSGLLFLNCHIIIILLWKKKATLDIYDSEAEDISGNVSGSNTSTLATLITKPNSDSSVGIQAWQWMKVTTSGLPHSRKHLSKTQDNSG